MTTPDPEKSLASTPGEAPQQTDQELSGDVPRIEFLYFAACPNAPQALALLREVLRAENIPGEIELIAVETEEAAQRYGFIGSPTIRVEGVDVSPPSAPTAPSLACRLYQQEDGRFTTHPSAQALREALRWAQEQRRTDA
jgi:hypothetical protein